MNITGSWLFSQMGMRNDDLFDERSELITLVVDWLPN